MIPHLHSIIIPHRDRLGHLTACVRSLAWAWDHYDQRDRLSVEVIIAHHGTNGLDLDMIGDLVPRGLLLSSCTWRDPMPVFNKAAMLNRGLDASHGDLVTFLDADAIVGPRFLDAAVMLLADPALMRVCYRVRYLPMTWTWPSDDRELLAMFAGYDSYPTGYFAHVVPWRNRPATRGQTPRVFGNSQGTIRRTDLGDIRHESAYAGRGFEDLHFLMDLWDRHGDRYIGWEPKDPARNLLITRHGYTADWNDPKAMQQNRDIFLARKKTCNRTHWSDRQ